MPTSRHIFALISLGCALLMAIALFMQYVMHLTPCYLCIVQRVFVIATGVIALIAFLHNPHTTGIRVYGGLESLPEDQVPACGPPADYLFDSFSFAEVLPLLLKGDGNCAKVDWSFLGLSIAGWLLVCFAAMILLALWQVVRPRR